MDRERLIEILEENLGVTDEWGGSKLADWKWGCNVLVDGIDAAADAILEDAYQSADMKDVIVMACQLENARDIIKRIIRVGELKSEYDDPANKMMMIARECLDDTMPEN